MPGSHAAMKLLALDEFDTDDMIGRPDMLDQANTLAAVVNDYVWGVVPPAPTVIPYGWLSPPAVFRADQPINAPQVQQAGAGTSVRPNAASIAQYGEFPLSVTLTSLSPYDPPALAIYLSTYYSGFRMRNPSLTVNLLDARRTQDEIWRVLGVRIGDRILIPDAPATWPEGANTLFVEGVTHTVSQNERKVVWNCSPVIGATPGAVGPWFREGVSVSSDAGGTDSGPF